MHTVYDVQQLLKRFGAFIYMGDRLSDLEVMESEIKELYFANLIQKEQFQQALFVLRSEIIKEQKNKE
ncbi:YqgQ family protein [Bacillus sp. FSL K6-3431]|uniref:YqgQ family protein n=1 Tax=Bacillus sp. FSL K6-3431 TaxID=2921500 RepID=UPI0030FCCBE3